MKERIFKNNLMNRMNINSFKKECFSAVSFSIFIALSVMMFAVSVLLFTNLSGAIDNLMDKSKCTDFLQMNAGDIDYDQIEEFAINRSDVRDYQIMKFLNLDNNLIFLKGKSLSESNQDNGLCVQSNSFDFLLDLNDTVVIPESGKVYVPVFYKNQYELEAGDEMIIAGESLTIEGFIRDSQMNSAMASSKRFVVCESDYERFTTIGSEEYLIEFLLNEGYEVGDFQNDYEDSGLPLNGPTINKSLIKLMNALSDGIMIFIIMMVSIVVLVISLICMRFMLLTRVDSEKVEIGTLKAIGISRKDINSMYLNRYKVLVFAGAVLGIVLSFAVAKPLSKETKLLYGVSTNAFTSVLITVGCCTLLTLIVIAFVKKVLKKINDMTAIKALRRDDDSKQNRRSLAITFVVALGVILIVIPVNLYNTMSSKHFVTYMGVGQSDYRIDIRQVENIDEVEKELINKLDNDKTVSDYAIYETSSCKTINREGEIVNILVEVGDHTKFPLEYYLGEAPKQKNEVAMSLLLADELGVTAGDTIQIQINEDFDSYIISGIYSDITNGGKTSKVYSDSIGTDKEKIWCIAYINLKEGYSSEAWADNYQDKGIEAINISQYVNATYGTTIDQIKNAAIIIKFVSFLIMVLMISLFLKLKIQRDRMQISIKKALGFVNKDIKKEYIITSIKYCVAGIVAGLILGNILGEQICNIALKQLGAVGFKFEINVFELIVVIPVIALAASLIATWIGAKQIEKESPVYCLRGRE